MDLIITVALALALTPIAVFTTGIFRIILGVAFLIFFPGYTLMAALFPRKDSMGNFERVGLSLVLSFAVIALTGLVLNYTPWGIRFEPVFIAITSFILISSMVALARRRNLPQSEEFEPGLRIKMPRLDGTSRLDRALSVGLVLATIGALAVLVFVLATPRTEEPFTHFYILGAEDSIEHYPQRVVLGEQAEVTIGIINHEHREASYRVEVIFDGEIAQEIGPIDLATEQEWREKVNLVPFRVGDDQKVEFLLYEGNGDEPCSKLHIWLDVIEEE
ncbi:MAG: DUF1616 domain-containing protein [Chloroflexota bacterium]|nr:DUF1616 domain-containing protein [Chloroflexota bacterium]